MTISTYGTAFTSYNVKTEQKTKEDIKKEDVAFDSSVEKTNKTENISYHTTIKETGALPAVFTDPVSGKFALVSLKEETIDRLSSRFGENNIVKKDDGSVRLIDDAEAFVAGWFADIAYKREFLSADENNDGQLTQNEYDNTKNDFGVEIMALTEYTTGEERLLAAAEKIIDNDVYGLSKERYLKEIGYYRNYRENNIATSLDDELNTTIQIDKDFNGKITLEEAYSTEENIIAEDVVLRHIEEFGISTTPSDFENIKEIENFDFLINFILDLFLQKNEKEQEKIMKKITGHLDSLKGDLSKVDTNFINKIYTQEHLERISEQKETSNTTLKKDLSVYS